MPEDLVEQVPHVHDACAALGVPIVTRGGFEADDVIGSLAARAVAAGLDVAIVTGDKDFFQLVDDRIQIFNPRDDGAWFDAAGVREKFGVRPDQVVDVLALMGGRQRQRQGRAGHRREECAGPADRVRHARPAAGARGRTAEEEAPKRPDQARRGRAPQPRAGPHPHRRAGGRRPDALPLSGRGSGTVLRPVLGVGVPSRC